MSASETLAKITKITDNAYDKCVKGIADMCLDLVENDNTCVELHIWKHEKKLESMGIDHCPPNLAKLITLLRRAGFKARVIYGDTLCVSW